ncbi:hypothetical protein PoB_001108300 [Plakobranchus ocellatus]|uniref:Uncharacterized protein n=1 Tax=Plakobranchus ocellatus TaxID=259542 RepID=A0AAV3YQQ3_9GAST|nr:hypothetical protein PoB_001108300 [Plakobranchus ocellatus]
MDVIPTPGDMKSENNGRRGIVIKTDQQWFQNYMKGLCVETSEEMKEEEERGRRVGEIETDREKEVKRWING